MLFLLKYLTDVKRFKLVLLCIWENFMWLNKCFKWVMQIILWSWIVVIFRYLCIFKAITKHAPEYLICYCWSNENSKSLFAAKSFEQLSYHFTIGNHSEDLWIVLATSFEDQRLCQLFFFHITLILFWLKIKTIPFFYKSI